MVVEGAEEEVRHLKTIFNNYYYLFIFLGFFFFCLYFVLFLIFLELEYYLVGEYLV